MGMDLVPNTNNVDVFHANWHGWSTLRTLLIQCGADTSSMAGSNDGDAVTGDEAREWSRKLREHVGDIIVLHHIDSSTRAGYRDEIRVADTAPPGGESVVTMMEHQLGASTSPLDEQPDIKDFIDRFITFLAESNGFHQC